MKKITKIGFLTLLILGGSGVLFAMEAPRYLLLKEMNSSYISSEQGNCLNISVVHDHIKKLTPNKAPRKLEIYGFDIFPSEFLRDLVAALKNNKNIKEFLLTCNSPVIFDVLFFDIFALDHLTRINISRVKLDSASLIALAESLKLNTTLTDLELNFNEVKRIKNIVDILHDNNSLTHLSITNNELQLEDAQAIAELLLVNKTLTCLEIYRNGFDDEAMASIALALMSNKTLKSIRVDGKVETLASANFARMFGKNVTLEKVNISYCDISVENSKIVFDSISKNESIKYINIRGNKTNPKMRQEMEDYSKRNKHITFFYD